MGDQVRYSPEQVAEKLAVADEMRAEGKSVRLVLERIGIDRKTYYQWQKRREETRPTEPHSADSATPPMSAEPDAQPQIDPALVAPTEPLPAPNPGPAAFPDWDDGAEVFRDGTVYQKRDGDWAKVR